MDKWIKYVTRKNGIEIYCKRALLKAVWFTFVDALGHFLSATENIFLMLQACPGSQKAETFWNFIRKPDLSVE